MHSVKAFSSSGQFRGARHFLGSLWSALGKPQATWKISGFINRDFAAHWEAQFWTPTGGRRAMWPIR